MANEILFVENTQFRFRGSGFSPADAATDYSRGTPTNVDLTLSALANNAGRQSAKVDLGATRGMSFAVHAAFDFTGETPTVDNSVRLYWAPSNSATDANANVAGNSGLDAAAPDGALGSITLAEFLKQCQYIGALIVHDGAVVQNGFVGIFTPTLRYGQMIVHNTSGDAFEADNVESAVWMDPLVPQGQ